MQARRHKDSKPSLWDRLSPVCSPPLCAQQPVDESTQPIRVTENRPGDLDTASSHQDEIALHLLIFGVGRFEMLMPVAQRPPAGLRQSQRGVAAPLRGL